jgi:hypothetical protein
MSLDRPTLVAIVVVALLATGGPARAADKKGTTSAGGGACQVTGGANKGKSGTYDSDGWCVGDWGGTACKDDYGQDTGKCKDGAARVSVPRGAAGTGKVFDGTRPPRAAQPGTRSPAEVTRVPTGGTRKQ